MTRHREIERVLQVWLAEGPSEMPDRLFDGLVDRVERVPQRHLARITTRFFAVNPMIRFAATAAALTIVAVVGLAILTRPGSNVAGPPSPSPVPTATESPSATAAACNAIGNAADCAGNLAAGSHSTKRFLARATFVVPEGWANPDDMANAYSLELQSDYANEPTFRSVNSGPSIILFDTPEAATVDASCNVTSDPNVATANALASWVASRPGIVASKPTSIAIGSLTGWMVDVQVDPAWTKLCSQMDGNHIPYPDPVKYVALIRTNINPPDGGWSFTEWGPSAPERQRFIFVDLGGGKKVAIIVDTPIPSAFETFTAKAMPIIQSLTFRP